MTIEKTTLQPGVLPDGTAKSQSGGTKGSLGGATPADLKRGYMDTGFKRMSPFDADITGENTVGDPWMYGGVLGRPRGNAR